MNFKWDSGAGFFFSCSGIRSWLAFGSCIWRCPVVNVVMIQCRSYKAGSGISLVPGEAGLTVTTPSLRIRGALKLGVSPKTMDMNFSCL